jgi:hypothetical protein
MMPAHQTDFGGENICRCARSTSITIAFQAASSFPPSLNIENIANASQVILEKTPFVLDVFLARG